MLSYEMMMEVVLLKWRHWSRNQRNKNVKFLGLTPSQYGLHYTVDSIHLFGKRGYIRNALPPCWVAFVSSYVCVCVCVCLCAYERERELEREQSRTKKPTKIYIISFFFLPHSDKKDVNPCNNPFAFGLPGCNPIK